MTAKIKRKIFPRRNRNTRCVIQISRQRDGSTRGHFLHGNCQRCITGFANFKRVFCSCFGHRGDAVIGSLVLGHFRGRDRGSHDGSLVGVGFFGSGFPGILGLFLRLIGGGLGFLLGLLDHGLVLFGLVRALVGLAGGRGIIGHVRLLALFRARGFFLGHLGRGLRCRRHSLQSGAVRVSKHRGGEHRCHHRDRYQKGDPLLA